MLKFNGIGRPSRFMDAVRNVVNEAISYDVRIRALNMIEFARIGRISLASAYRYYDYMSNDKVCYGSYRMLARNEHGKATVYVYHVSVDIEELF